jgi:hypothetical protein
LQRPVGWILVPILEADSARDCRKTAQVEELRRTIATIVEKGKSLNKSRKKPLCSGEVGHVEGHPASDKETDQIFRTVELQARLSGLKVNRVLRVERSITTSMEYPIELDVLGTYHNVGLS